MRRGVWLAVVAMLVAGTALAQRPVAPGMGPGGPGGPRGPMGPALGPPPGGPPPGMREPGPEALERLGLSDAQRAKLADVHDAAMRTMIRLDADARIAELDLERLIEADRLDAKAVDAAVERITTARGKMLQSRIAERLAVRDLLTPDQRARLRRLRAAGEGAMDGRPPGR